MSNPLGSVGIAVLTYNAAKYLPRSLPPLVALMPEIRVLVVDSSSHDNTADIARSLGAEVLVIPQREFNHGTTRELARKVLGTDIVVLMTQDAIAVDPDSIRKLVAPVASGEAAVSYARQLPHDGAGFFESFPRLYNYPPASELRSAADIPRLGPWTFFCSNSCCAWSNAALNVVGGFGKTLSAEDTIATAKLVRAGYKILYCSDALVRHSHSYTLADEFHRYFDMGYVRRENAAILLGSGGDEKRGSAMILEMTRRLWSQSPWKIPYCFVTAAVKLVGYRAGYHGARLPVWLKRRLSSQPKYWQGISADRPAAEFK